MIKCPTCGNEETIIDVPENENILICDFCFTMFCKKCAGANLTSIIDSKENECKECGNKIIIYKEYTLSINIDNIIVNIPASLVPEGKSIDLYRMNRHFFDYRLPDVNWGWLKFNSEKKKWIFSITNHLKRYTQFKFLTVEPDPENEENYKIIDEIKDNDMSIFDPYEIDPMAILEMIDRKIKIKFIPQVKT